jgi:hypothetical protein
MPGKRRPDQVSPIICDIPGSADFVCFLSRGNIAVCTPHTVNSACLILIQCVHDRAARDPASAISR